MADKGREDLLQQVKEQGDLVRKLKAAKGDKTQVCSYTVNNAIR